MLWQYTDNLPSPLQVGPEETKSGTLYFWTGPMPDDKLRESLSDLIERDEFVPIAFLDITNLITDETLSIESPADLKKIRHVVLTNCYMQWLLNPYLRKSLQQKLEHQRRLLPQVMAILELAKVKLQVLLRNPSRDACLCEGATPLSRNAQYAE